MMGLGPHDIRRRTGQSLRPMRQLMERYLLGRAEGPRERCPASRIAHTPCPWVARATPRSTRDWRTAEREHYGEHRTLNFSYQQGPRRGASPDGLRHQGGTPTGSLFPESTGCRSGTPNGRSQPDSRFGPMQRGKPVERPKCSLLCQPSLPACRPARTNLGESLRGPPRAA